MGRSCPKPKKKKRIKRLKGYQISRKLVIERDNNQCRICGKQANDCHHIIFRRYGNDSVYNLILLCRFHHTMVHNNNRKWFDILFNMQLEIYPNLTKQMMKRK